MKEAIILKFFILITFVIIFLGIKDIAYSACLGGPQRGHGSFYPNYNCDWSRGNDKCNDDSECCPGKRCNSFGYCEACV